jgi:hypothetical protein
MARWIHHLREETEEACDEMLALGFHHTNAQYHEHKVNLITELSQVAQLAQSMMTLLYLNREMEEKTQWQPEDLNIYSDPEPPSPSPLSLSKVDSGDQKLKG